MGYYGKLSPLFLFLTIASISTVYGQFDAIRRMGELQQMTPERMVMAAETFIHEHIPPEIKNLMELELSPFPEDQAKPNVTKPITIGGLICQLITRHPNCSLTFAETALQLYLESIKLSSGCAMSFSKGFLQNIFDLPVTNFGSALFTNQFFALKQIDSIGRPEIGLLEGNFAWSGQYEECIAIDAPIPGEKQNYRGQYCAAQISFPGLMAEFASLLSPNKTDLSGACQNPQFANPAITWGVCFPRRCSNQDVTRLLQKLTFSRKSNFSPICSAACVPELPPKLNTNAIVMIVVLSIFGFLTVFASLIDYFKVFKEDAPKNIFQKAILVFSLPYNTKLIFDTSTKPGQINCIHGLRFISMTWVIIGHCYSVYGPNTDNALSILNLKNKFVNQVLLNATFSVDTFFVLSGCLLSFLWFKEVKKSNGKFVKSPVGWIMFYVHRYFRLTSVYIVIFWATTILVPYMARGPWYLQFGKDFNSDCYDNWWHFFLYVNNLVKPNTNCHGETWYLANDMQFYILSPLLLVPLWFVWQIGVGVCGVIMTISLAIITWSYIHWTFPLPAVMTANNPGAPPNVMELYQKYMYNPPWTRCNPYILGILVGYLMHKKPKFKLNSVINGCLWFLAAFTACAIIYGCLPAAQGTVLPESTKVTYSVLCRTLWGACICWVVYACFTGNGGPVNTILSCKVWMPFSRMTYCAYLIHISVILIIGSQFDYKGHWTGHFGFLMTKVWGVLTFSYLVSFFTCACIEYPLLHLEKMIFPNRRPNSKSKPKSEKVAPDSSGEAPTVIPTPTTLYTETPRNGNPSWPLWDQSSVRPYQNGQINPVYYEQNPEDKENIKNEDGDKIPLTKN